MSVKNGAELLDRLIKDIVSEKSLFTSTKTLSTVKVPDALDEKEGPVDPVLNVPGTIHVPGSNLSFFNLARFIPLLVERIRALSPATRIFLVNWISVLDSVPDLELVAYLPEFLDGLFGYLSDPSPDVRTATLNVLGEFLKEIRDVVEIQREKGATDNEQSFTSPLVMELSEKSASAPEAGTEMGQTLSAQGSASPPSVPSKGDTPNISKGGSSAYVPGQGVVLDFGKMTQILRPHISSKDEETQATALRWINEFITMARELMLPFTTLLIDAILPCLSHSVMGIRSIAVETNTNLYRLVYDSTSESLSTSSTDVMANLSTLNTPSTGPETHDPKTFNVDESVIALMKQFQDEHEETRVAALDWLLMLHKNVPKKVMSADSTMVNSLLATLSDHSEDVVKRDLQLLAQISHSSDDEYFTGFMVNLLSLFSTDRRLLESRGSLIIRQLSFSLNPERMYRTFAEILERDEDIEFASIMVQNLNIILITAPELSELRKRLKKFDSRDGSHLFTVLYKSWSHNPVALFSLCLLASAYEHASNLLQIFADLEITVALLIQIDKLVQLLESPVFTYLRLQLLEPDKHPYLFKCLYGILMLLPQSSAFATLRNRLNSVSSLVTLYATPGMSGLSKEVSGTPQPSAKRYPLSFSHLYANASRLVLCGQRIVQTSLLKTTLLWFGGRIFWNILGLFKRGMKKAGRLVFFGSKWLLTDLAARAFPMHPEKSKTRSIASRLNSNSLLSEDSISLQEDLRHPLASEKRESSSTSGRGFSRSGSGKTPPSPLGLRSLNRKGSAPPASGRR